MSEIINSISEQGDSQWLSEGLSERELFILGIADKFKNSIQQRLELSYKLTHLPDELLNDIKEFAEDRDLLRFVLEKINDHEFVSDVDEREGELLSYYIDRYPYLSYFKFEDFKLGASLNNYTDSVLPDLPIDLRSLMLGFCRGLKDFSGIEGCKKLQSLEMSFLESFTSLEGIQGCPNLKSLKFSMCDRFPTNLKGIEGCKNLESLSIQWCKSLRSLSGIQSCENLKSIHIDKKSRINLDPESKEILKQLEENPDVEVIYI